MLILSPAHLPELENHACKHESNGVQQFRIRQNPRLPDI